MSRWSGEVGFWRKSLERWDGLERERLRLILDVFYFFR